MSNFRHPDRTVEIRSFGVNLANGQQVPALLHEAGNWHKLIYATRGVTTVHTDDSAWVAPPHRGVWIPAGVRFRLELSGAVALRMLYIRKRRLPGLKNCSVVNITPLMRELIVRANRIGALDTAVPEQRRLLGVMLDELKLQVAAPLKLPLPRDPRAAQFAALAQAGTAPIESLLRQSGASRRTLERLFRLETAMSLGQWMRRQKLLDALRRLAAGESVDRVALDLGYNSGSAFIAMFRRELGRTPKRYFATAPSLS